MSKHYEERTYVRGYGPSEYDEYRVRRRSSSRSSRGRYYDGHGRQRALSRSDSGSSISTVSDYEYKGHYVTSERSLVRVPRDVIRAPTPPPVIQRVVERAPTPEPDIVERVIVRPQPQQLIERIIERPRTPPPKIIDKEITEPAPPPIVRTRIVKVDHSGRHYSHGSYQQAAAAAIPVPVQKVRHVETIPRTSGLSTYGYQDAGYVDYYAGAAAVPNRSYSQSYSAVELYPSTVYVPQSPGPNISYNVATTGASAYPSTNYNCYPYTQQSTYGTGYGYNYGYRPAATSAVLASSYPYVSNNAPYTNSQYNLYNPNAQIIGPTY